MRSNPGLVKSSRAIDLIGLVLFSIGVVAVGMRSYANTPEMATGDYSCHMMHTAAYARLLDSGLSGPDIALAAMTWIGRYPPVAYAWSAAVYQVAGASWDTAILSQMLLFIPVILATFLAAERLAGRAAGWAAALLVAASPNLLFNAQQYLLDTCMTACVALAIWLFLRSDDFESTWASLGLGLAMGAGMMTKYSFAFFLLPVWLVGVVQASVLEWRRKGPLFVVLHWVLALNAAVFAFYMGLRGLAYYPVMAGGDPLGALVCPAMWKTILIAAEACLIYALCATLLSRVLGGGRDRLLHAHYSLALCLLVMAPWYLSNMLSLSAIWSPAVDINPTDPSIDRRVHWHALSGVIGPLWWVPVGLGVIAWLHPRLRAGWPVALAFLCGLYFMVVHLPPATRYVAPFAPLVAILAVYWTGRWPVARRVALGLAVLTAVGVLGLRCAAPEAAHRVTISRWSPVVRLTGAFSLLGGSPQIMDPSRYAMEQVIDASGGKPVTVAVVTARPFSFEGVVPYWLNLQARSLLERRRVAFVPVLLQDEGPQVVRLYDVCWAVQYLVADSALLNRLPRYTGPMKPWQPDRILFFWEQGEDRERVVRLMEGVYGRRIRHVGTWFDGMRTTVEVWDRGVL